MFLDDPDHIQSQRLVNLNALNMRFKWMDERTEVASLPPSAHSLPLAQVVQPLGKSYCSIRQDIKALKFGSEYVASVLDFQQQWASEVIPEVDTSTGQRDFGRQSIIQSHKPHKKIKIKSVHYKINDKQTLFSQLQKQRQYLPVYMARKKRLDNL